MLNRNDAESDRDQIKQSFVPRPTLSSMNNLKLIKKMRKKIMINNIVFALVYIENK